MDSHYPVYTLINECHDCYKCIRECPVKAIKIENGHASVIPNKCIACGNCVKACPSNAKRVRSDIAKAKNLILAQKKVFVSLAPSWSGVFEHSPKKMIAILKTLGFSEIIRILITNLTGITNGPTGITGIPNTYMNLYVIAGILALIVIFMIAMIRSSYGRALLAIREDEVAAQAMGVNLFKHKMIAFVLSGFVAGIGGGLLAAYTQAIDPKMFQFTVAYEILLMVVLGGQGSVTGSVVGAFIVRIAMEKLRFLDGTIDFGFFEYKGIEGMRMVVFSALLMLVIILWRRGIFGNKEFSWNSIFAFFARFKKSPKKEVQN